MRYTVVLQRRADDSYQAAAPALPGLVEIRPTREAALAALVQTLQASLATTEFVSVDLPAPAINPWLATSGSFADDPTLETILRDIYTARDAE